jgi:sulfite reductase beta subunit-like hemoprotein
MPKTIEQIKAEGLTLDLNAVTADGFKSISADDLYRMKTFGLCSPRKQEQDFMIRIRVPSGAVTSAQTVRVAELAARHAGGWVHLSTRQNFELHMVAAEVGPMILDELENVGLTARSSCGDTIRNIATCECTGFCPTSVVDVRDWADLIAAHVRAEAEFFDHNLPRKVNVYLSDCVECADEALFNDVSFAGALGPDGEPGFRIWVGGGQGGQQPMLGQELTAWAPLSDALPTMRAVLHVLIDNGERAVRARAKLKFLIRQRGMDWFKAEVEAALPRERQRVGHLTPADADAEWQRASMPAAPDAATAAQRRPGVVFQQCRLPQGVSPMLGESGYYRLEVRVPLGEISSPQLAWLAAAARSCADRVLYLTKRQNVELRWIPGDLVQQAADWVDRIGLRRGDTGGLVDVVPCVGMEYCPIGLTSTQTVAARLIEHLEETPPSSDVAGLRLNVSGCPNSCAQHWVSDIGLSGLRIRDGKTSVPAYELIVGGGHGEAARIGNVLGRVHEQDAPIAVDAVLAAFRERRQEQETMAAFVERTGAPAMADLVAARLGAGVLIREVERAQA